MQCRICGSDGPHALFDVKEMMYGMDETFPYMQCQQCDCLQIVDIPTDLPRYYRGAYYSYVSADQPVPGGLKGQMIRKRDQYALYQRGALGKLLDAVYPTPYFDLFKPLGLNPRSRVMDVGCGAGNLLDTLARLGMVNLVGLDPFIDAPMSTPHGARILKQDVLSASGTYDLIMFNHSFEHIPEQLATLRHAASLIRPGGHCMVRIPTVSSYAWKHYGVNWVQLDAPRHLFLHSVDSMTRLARQAGLTLDSVVYDSTAFQFWGSEQYLQGIPLRSDAAPASPKFSDQAMAAWAEQAAELNRSQQGDQAIFYLRR